MADVEEPTVEAPEVEEEEEEEEEVLVPEDDFVAVGGATEIKLFGKWAFDDIEVRDISLVVCDETVLVMSFLDSY
jgi:small subunit ribosomal protein S5e